MSIQTETWDKITTLADIEKLEAWVENDSTYRTALEKHLRETCVALRRAWLERDQARAERDAARVSPKQTLEWGPNEGNMTWDAAMELAELKGNGWRLPTVQELVAQFDYDNGKPAPGFRHAWYWSSSPLGDGYAWSVDFGSGIVGSSHRYSEGGVRCVRWVKP